MRSSNVSCRALRDVFDELRGTCGAWEIKGWYVAPAPSHYYPLLIALAYTLGEWLLVLAAAGGVGMAAIQIGKGTNRSTYFNLLLTSLRLNLGFCAALGARVIACASPSKLDAMRTAGGADFTVDYTKDGWQKEV